MNSEAINSYFSWCISLFYDVASILEVSYGELGIWFFIIIHPIITLALAYWVFKLRRQVKGGKTLKKRDAEVIRLDPPAIQMP